MTAAEIAALVVAGGSILGTLMTFLSSARGTDLKAVEVVVGKQNELIKTLQDELDRERAERRRLAETIEARDKVIDQLKKVIDQLKIDLDSLRKGRAVRGGRA